MTRVGRPRKAEGEKVEYQLIAVHTKDYKTFVKKADESDLKKVEAFHQMVNTYKPKKLIKSN